MMQQTKRTALYLLLFSMLLLLSHCAGDSGNQPADPGNTPSEGLIGGWTGTRFFYINKADSTQFVDLASYGVSFTVAISPDSSYQNQTVFLGQSIQESGFISITGSTLTFTQSNDELRSASFELNGLTMYLRFEDEGFDFNQDGTDEPAILEVELTKTN